MRNKIYLILFLALISNLSISNSLNSEEIFNFNITELEITNDGTVFTGSDGGEVYTNDGTSVTAENFEFNKFSSLEIINDKNNSFSKIIIISPGQKSLISGNDLAIIGGKINQISSKSKNKIIKVTKLFKETKADKETLKLVEDYTNLALKSINSLSIPVENKQVFIDFSNSLLERKL